MRQVEFVPFRLTEIAEIFTIRIDGKKNTELQEFLISFKDADKIDLKKDFEQIVKTLAEIGHQGAKEIFFRPEGKMKDRLCAIPLFTSKRGQKQNGTLRLYCLRISDQTLIVGGGGIKTTKTYEEDKVLSAHIMTLQKIDKELTKLENEGLDINKIIYNLTIDID